MSFAVSARHRVTVSFLYCFLSALCALSSVTLLAGCGRKTQVRPPELVAPEPINDLKAEVKDKGIRLQWSRPQRYVYGGELDDLASFVVLRATRNGTGQTSAFTQIAVVPVEDRDRFRQAKKFSYTDEQLTPSTLYRYRVQAFTLDGYYSKPSNIVEVAWQKGP